jgi:hypothetical protein
MHLQSPQFQLSGLVETGLGPKPRLRVCNTPECSYLQMCSALKPAIDALLPNRTSLLCGTDSVSLLTFPRIPRLIDEYLCPPGICGVLGKFVNEGCPILAGGIGGLAGPRGMSVPARDDLPGRCTPQPPACDPRCSRIDCCGGPSLPPDFKSGDAMVAWADGGVVRFADGANILRRGAASPEPLKSGTRVAVGDLIALPPASRMELHTTDGKVLRTPEKGMLRKEDGRVALMMITGESALQSRRPGVARPAKLPLERILRVHAAPWAARGEGGMLLTDERRIPFKYSEQELNAAQMRKRSLMSEPAKR